MALPAILLNPSVILLWLHVGRQVYKLIQGLVKVEPKWKDIRKIRYIVEPEKGRIKIKPKKEEEQ